MKLNKTVYLEGGGTQLCEYDTEDLTLSPLWIIIFVLSLALNAFAIIGNSIVVTACFLQKKKPPLLIYIHALAFADLFYALVAPFYTYRYVLKHFPKLVINFELAGRLSHHVTLIGNTFSSVSSWLVVALTIDRLILTKLPFRAKEMSTAKRAYIVILVIVILCCIINAFWVYEFLEVPIAINPCNGYWSIPKQVIREDGSIMIPFRYKKFYQIYSIVAAVLVLYALPAIIMGVSNTLILLQLKQTKVKTTTQSTAISKRRYKEVRLTKMIVIVSIIFMICNIPDIVTRLLWKYIPPLIVSNIQPFAHLSLMVNVAANFVVYSLYNRHLFATILRMLKKSGCCPCCFDAKPTEATLTMESSSSANNQSNGESKLTTPT